AMHRAEMAVSGIADPHLEFAGLAGQGADYSYGELRWLSGENCGLGFAILSGAGNSIRLADQPVRPVSIGDKALLTAGCHKNFATCRDQIGRASCRERV